jgi:hypothetical protein
VFSVGEAFRTYLILWDLASVYKFDNFFRFVRGSDSGPLFAGCQIFKERQVSLGLSRGRDQRFVLAHEKSPRPWRAFAQFS